MTELTKAITPSLHGTSVDTTLTKPRDIEIKHVPSGLQVEMVPASKKTKPRWPYVAMLALVLLMIFFAILAYRKLPPGIFQGVQSSTRSILVLPTNIEGVASTTIDPRLLVREQAMELRVTAPTLEMIDPLIYEKTEGELLERARALAADEILSSEIVCGATGCSANFRRIDAREGFVIASETLQLPVKTLALRDAVGAALFRVFDLKGFKSGVQIDRAEYETYLDLLAKENRSTSSLPELVEAVHQLRLKTPGFPPVYSLELRLTRRLSSGRDGERYQRKIGELLSLARARFPGDYRFYLAAAENALHRNDSKEARASLAQLEELRPDLLELSDLRAKLLELEGDPKAALELLHQSLQRSRSFRSLFNLAIMESRHGSMAQARELLAEAEILAPWQDNIKRLAAQWALVYGEPSEAIKRYEALVVINARFGLRVNLGLAYMVAGRFKDSKKQFEAATVAIPNHPLILLNQADATWLVGDTQEAEALYRKVIELTAGEQRDWQYRSASAQAHAHLNEAVSALTHLQAALDLAPDPAQIAYEASLVHALVGERNSALIHAKRALRAGYSQQWFSLPWFQTIQEELTQ